MRLTPLQASRVLTRKKSQHRIKPRLRRQEFKDAQKQKQVMTSEALHVDSVVPVQVQRTEKDPLTQQNERRWATTCHVRITAVYEQDVDVISDTEVKAEGYDTKDEFLEAWGKHKRCTVLCFEPVERPRFLAPVNRADSEGRSYTSSAGGAVSKGQSIDDDTQARFSKEGRERDAERRGEAIEKEADTLRDQIDTLKAWAAKNGLDARSELRVLERRLQEKLRRKAA